MTISAARILVIASALSLIQASAAKAQDEGTSRRVPLVIAIDPSRDFGDSDFVVISRSEGDVVVVPPEHANAITLSRAVRMVLATRNPEVPRAPAGAMLRTPRGANDRVYPWMGRVVGRLNAADQTFVGQVGRVKSVTIWLPRS